MRSSNTNKRWHSLKIPWVSNVRHCLWVFLFSHTKCIKLRKTHTVFEKLFPLSRSFKATFTKKMKIAMPKSYFTPSPSQIQYPREHWFLTCSRLQALYFVKLMVWCLLVQYTLIFTHFQIISEHKKTCLILSTIDSISFLKTVNKNVFLD